MSNQKSEMEKQNRINNYESRHDKLIDQGYQETICKISIVKANLLALVTAGPIALLVVLIYIGAWGSVNIKFNLLGSFLILAVMAISIPVHEFLHGVGWHFFCKDKWKSIHFGVIWEYLTPYCHCKEPLSYKRYLFGGLLPFFVLGIGLSVFGIVIHNSMWLALGAYNILAAGGDTTIAIMVLKYRNSILLDHPTECGFIAFQK